MAVSTSISSILLGVVASVLTIVGVVVAGTDPNPTGVVHDPLALNGYPPRSATLLVTVSDGQSYGLSADVNVNFATNAVEATVNFPLMFSVSAVDLRMINGRLFARSASTSSGGWLSLPFKWRSMFGYSLELTKPDIALISGFGQEVISTSGGATTYTFTRDHVVLASVLGSAKKSLEKGTLVWSITTGRQGEVTSSRVDVTSSHTTTISATVVAYNRPTTVVAPRVSTVVPSSLLHRLLASPLLNSLMLPLSFSSLIGSQLR